jgi:hypothetical protein
MNAAESRSEPKAARFDRLDRYYRRFPAIDGTGVVFRFDEAMKRRVSRSNRSGWHAFREGALNQISPRLVRQWHRAVEMVQSGDPTLGQIWPTKFSDGSEFQFYQGRRGDCLIKVVLAAGCGTAKARPFLDKMQARVGSSISFELALVNELAGAAGGKRPSIDQRLDPSELGVQA